MYDTPQTITHSYFTEHSGSDIDIVVPKPPGATRGILRAINVTIITAFAGATTRGSISFGTTVGGTEIANSIAPDTAAIGTQFAAAESDLLKQVIGPSDNINVRFVASTGAGPLGQANLDIVVDWDMPQPGQIS